eukprot:2877019-Karenia_brevis.AAC.1
MGILGFDADSQVVIPAGFGACGAPNDGLHGDLHRIRNDREKLLIGWHDDLTLRDHGESLGVAND